MMSDAQNTRQPTRVRPAPAVAETQSYRIHRAAAPLDLYLDSNEGAVPPAEVIDHLKPAMPDILRRYPKREGLERQLADWLDVTPERVIVTGGSNDAIDRAVRATLCPGREMIIPAPSFEMIVRYCRLAGGTVVDVPWPGGPLPREAMLSAIKPETGMIALVTPNNPLGCAATPDDLRALAQAAPHALLLLDGAYNEFADEDLTAAALAEPNVIMTRTLSKAWGLAGLRVGYAVGPPEIIDWLRAAGQIYNVAGPSLAIASELLETGDALTTRYIAAVKDERRRLTKLLTELGFEPQPSQANFVFATCDNPAWYRDALAGLGIGIRYFQDRTDVPDGIRISCPGDAGTFDRLEAALRTVCQPEALLFDMDGVLADEGDAYTEAVIRLANEWNVTVTADDVAQVSAEQPQWNRIDKTVHFVNAAGYSITHDDALAALARVYYPDDGPLGWNGPRPALVSVDWLRQLSKRYPLAAVTSRFRGEAEKFMRWSGYDQVIQTVICADDTEPKPSPKPLLLAMERLGAQRAWMVGDSGSDMKAARAAGVLPIGCIAPRRDASERAPALTHAGAGRVINGVQEIEELLP
jgi:histidinol-phosphate aminotransferase